MEVSSLVKESGLLRDKDSGTFVIDADALSSIDQNTEFILLMLLGNKMVAFHHARADLMERISKVTQYLSLAYYAAYGPYDPSDTTTMAGMRLDFVRDCLELSIIDYGSEVATDFPAELIHGKVLRWTFLLATLWGDVGVDAFWILYIERLFSGRISGLDARIFHVYSKVCDGCCVVPHTNITQVFQSFCSDSF